MEPLPRVLQLAAGDMAQKETLAFFPKVPRALFKWIKVVVAVVMQPPSWTASNSTDMSPASGAQKSETRLCTGRAFSACPTLWSSECP